jgi:hypothetical protein
LLRARAELATLAAHIQTLLALLRVLSRYHLENYFLNESVLASVFEGLESNDSWLREPDLIANRLRELARELVPYTLALYASANFRDVVGNIDIMPKGCDNISTEELKKLLRLKSAEESSRVSESVEDIRVSEYVQSLASKVEQSLETGTEDWKSIIPGKPILSKFAGAANISVDRLKRSYISKASSISPSPFQEIMDIFESFSIH